MRRTFSTSDLLLELEKPEYRPVLEEFVEVCYPKNTLICSPSTNEDMVLLVKRGRVRVYLGYEDKEFTLAILERGGIYSTHTRTFVSAAEDSTLLCMATLTFHRHMASFPLFSRTVIGILGSLLTQSFAIIDGLVFKDVTQRLVEFFLHEAQSHGKPERGGVHVEIDLTMEQLAAVVGSSRQTVSSICNEMIKAGVMVRSGRKGYHIPNLELLKNFPHS